MSGELDTTFNTTGTVIYYDSNYSNILSINTQNDKILVSGNNEFNNLFLARYNNNGTIDTSFGVNGFIHTTYPVNNNYKSTVMMVQSTNKIILLCSSGGGSPKFILVRYTENGTLDNTFGISGVLNTNYNYEENYFCSILKQKNNDNFVITFFIDAIWKFQRYDENGISIGSLTNTIFNETNQYFCFCNAIDNNNNIIFGGRQNGALNNYNANKYIYCVYILIII